MRWSFGQPRRVGVQAASQRVEFEDGSTFGRFHRIVEIDTIGDPNEPDPERYASRQRTEDVSKEPDSPRRVQLGRTYLLFPAAHGDGRVAIAAAQTAALVGLTFGVWSSIAGYTREVATRSVSSDVRVLTRGTETPRSTTTLPRSATRSAHARAALVRPGRHGADVNALRCSSARRVSLITAGRTMSSAFAAIRSADLPGFTRDSTWRF
jgi:hypothetical protein